jgi:hypothetical protein
MHDENNTSDVFIGQGVRARGKFGMRNKAQKGEGERKGRGECV